MDNQPFPQPYQPITASAPPPPPVPVPPTPPTTEAYNPPQSFAPNPYLASPANPEPIDYVPPPPPPVATYTPPAASSFVPPAPGAPEQLLTPNPHDLNPVAVVEVYSTRGLEYAMLTLCLFLTAGALIAILLGLVNGGAHFAFLAFPLALLIVCLPVFSYLFLRQKRAEIINPTLKLDPSKRRLTQFTQLVAFAACLFNVIAFVFLVFSKLAGQSSPSVFKDIYNLIVVLVVAGGVLAYYWNDEHRVSR